MMYDVEMSWAWFVAFMLTVILPICVVIVIATWRALQ